MWFSEVLGKSYSSIYSKLNNLLKETPGFIYSKFILLNSNPFTHVHLNACGSLLAVTKVFTYSEMNFDSRVLPPSFSLVTSMRYSMIPKSLVRAAASALRSHEVGRVTNVGS